MPLPSPELQKVLRRLTQLLSEDVFEGWAATLEELATSGWRTPDEGRNKILSFYGGMGSLNDVVLQKDGKPRPMENEELDRLRHRLIELSRSI